MLLETEAIVLRSVDYQESSRIVTLFTQEKGKIAIIAKGARKPKSRYAGFFEIGQHLSISLYFKEGRGVHTLKEADFATRSFSNRTDLMKMIQLQRVMELSDQLLVEEEVNDEKWEFLVKMIPWLDQQAQVPPNLFCYAQLRIAEIQGIGLSVQQQPIEDGIQGIDLESGLITDRAHATRFYPLNPSCIQFLMLGIQDRSVSLLAFPLTNGERQKLEQTLDLYLQYHIDGLRPRRTDQIYREML